MHLSVVRVLEIYVCIVCLQIHVQVTSDCKKYHAAIICLGTVC